MSVRDFLYFFLCEVEWEGKDLFSSGIAHLLLDHHHRSIFPTGAESAFQVNKRDLALSDTAFVSDWAVFMSAFIVWPSFFWPSMWMLAMYITVEGDVGNNMGSCL